MKFLFVAIAVLAMFAAYAEACFPSKGGPFCTMLCNKQPTATKCLQACTLWPNMSGCPKPEAKPPTTTDAGAGDTTTTTAAAETTTTEATTTPA